MARNRSDMRKRRGEIRLRVLVRADEIECVISFLLLCSTSLADWEDEIGRRMRKVGRCQVERRRMGVGVL